MANDEVSILNDYGDYAPWVNSSLSRFICFLGLIEARRSDLAASRTENEDEMITEQLRDQFAERDGRTTADDEAFWSHLLTAVAEGEMA